MIFHLNKFCCFVFSLIFVFVILPGHGTADPVKEIQERIAQEKNELEKLKARLEKQNKTILAAGAKGNSVLRNLQKIDNQLKLKERELKIYQYNKKINQKKISQSTKQIALAEKQMESQKQILGKRLRAIYKEGNMFPVKVLFSAENFNDLIQRIKYMELVTAHDSSLFGKYDERLRQLEEGKKTLLLARTQLETLENDTLAKKSEIKNQKIEKSAFLENLNKKKTLGIKVKKEIQQASSNLNNLILKLEEKIEKGQGLDFQDKKGRLQLPVKGKFLNKFGKKRDKQYDTFIVYNGVDIKATKGTPVRAVSSGKVLFANELEGYGNLIIIGHGEDYHSLYGHLDEIITKVGRTVRSSQIIGRSGDTGSLVGETLYFELRHKGKPIEPTRWFQFAKK
ncbi:MAG: peptidase M23 [Nitrospinaceae bacterium]|nr:MAG: peptidase M23 [Nitrospinaceae bacterium]